MEVRGKAFANRIRAVAKAISPKSENLWYEIVDARVMSGDPAIDAIGELHRIARRLDFATQIPAFDENAAFERGKGIGDPDHTLGRQRVAQFMHDGPHPRRALMSRGQAEPVREVQAPFDMKLGGALHIVRMPHWRPLDPHRHQHVERRAFLILADQCRRAGIGEMQFHRVAIDLAKNVLQVIGVEADFERIR